MKNFIPYEKIFKSANMPHDFAKSELAAEMKDADTTLTNFYQ